MTPAHSGAESSIWHHLRLGQKVTLAVFASFLPLLFLGIQVANYSGSLVKNQTLDNLGLVSQVEARRVQGNVESITEDMDAVLRSNLVTQALLNQSDGNQVAGSNEQIRLLLAETIVEFEPQGMIGIELQVAGGTTERAGVAHESADPGPRGDARNQRDVDCSGVLRRGPIVARRGPATADGSRAGIARVVRPECVRCEPGGADR
ncbi:MAG: hypothetical protein O3C27_06045 [Actinomycetota bacterium]|nr:hypothetical protein [Actinomycetota bacterium]